MSVFRPNFRSVFRPIFRPLYGGGGGPAPGPLDGLDFLFRGYGLPTGAFQDATLTTPATVDGQAFGGWVDENGVAFTQANSSFKGTLKDVSGSWARRGDGVDDNLVKSSPIALGGDFTVSARIRTTGSGVIVGNSLLNVQILRTTASNTILFYDGVSSVESTAVTTRATPINITVIRTGTTVKIYEGITEIGSGTAGLSVDADNIGAILGGALEPVNGDIYAVLIADSDMTASLAQINDALNLLG